MAEISLLTIDPASGSEIPVPEDVVAAVGSVDRRLREALKKGNSFLAAGTKWQAIRKPGGEVILEVQVGGNIHVTEQFTFDELRDPKRAIEKVNETALDFINTLSDWVSQEYRRINSELEKLEVAG